MDYYGNSGDMFDSRGAAIDPDDPEPAEQPRCACGAYLPWAHTSECRSVAGIHQFIWDCRKCGGANGLVEIVPEPSFDGSELPF